eukprot:CAMPEP_0196130984 /NCGR_PEP_ID=MMETSP0910-20130528/1159_1 /TAXON_ID=49265 /ORGANISM="Thalassiosira rotula, Strain GSO102" /LENGTH=588 /DNA_ID=CAMNT_0041390379 /DNA_START=156 /DNA_END=1922 /DNA_ORIENTATION=-
MTSSILMSPNSIDSMAGFTADNCNTSTKSEDIIFISAATTDASAASSKETQKQLIDINAMTLEEEILKEETPEPDEEKQKQLVNINAMTLEEVILKEETPKPEETKAEAVGGGGEGKIDGYGEFLGFLEKDNFAHGTEREAGAEGETSELATPVGVMLGEGEANNESLNQDELNELNPKLHSEEPFPVEETKAEADATALSEEKQKELIEEAKAKANAPASSQGEASELGEPAGVPNIAKDDINIEPNLADGSSFSPQDPAVPETLSQSDLDLEDDDHDVNFINFVKLTEPSSSEYYYSASNRNTRQMLEKVKAKRPTKEQGGGPLEDSMHSRLSHVIDRRRASCYQGPEYLMKNGSKVQSIVKNSPSRGSTSRSTDDSTPSTERDAKEANKPKTKTWRLKFATVDIREHERVAGDNPCVSSGVPLSIGWGFYQHPPIDLDDYELNKEPSRDKIEMMVPASVRRSMLRDEFGVSISEMNAAMREVNITKRRRRHTVGAESMEGWQEVMQSTRRKFKRFIKRTSTAKEHEIMWENSRELAMMEYLKGGGSFRKSLDGVGVGKISNGPKVAPENGEGSPPIEISFPPGES